jgi:phage N-6-adenine-methyltransferase
MMPKQQPGKSKQDYRTPVEFLDAVKNRLKIQNFTWDLAADAQNSVCQGNSGGYWGIADNSLTKDWHFTKGWQWLNPPYADIRPWVEKSDYESAKGAHIAMLIPASVGANWWNEYVNYSAYQLFLNGRITFQGCETPYPKDCALLLYTPFIRSGNAVWTWQ